MHVLNLPSQEPVQGVVSVDLRMMGILQGSQEKRQMRKEYVLAGKRRKAVLEEIHVVSVTRMDQENVPKNKR